MASNFTFLHQQFPALEELGILAERYCRADAQACLMKLGLLCESMVKTMFVMDNITLSERSDAVERIDILQRRGVLPSDVATAFHLIRKTRNKAAHEGLKISEQKTIWLLQITHSLCQWFFQTYGDATYQNQAFVTPEAYALTPVAKSKDTAREQALLQKAAEEAHSAAPLPEEERRQRAETASRQRHVSEAETRLRIDEQLRKTGWEADSENIRHSKGARPQSGHDMAIAEWPTLLPDGRRGFADYALFMGTSLVGIIEAKAAHKDIPGTLDQQCKAYARHIRPEDAPHLLGDWRGYRVPFIFATNGRSYFKQWAEKSGIWFQDLRNAANAPQALHGWPSPSGIEELLQQDMDAASQRLAAMSEDLLTDPSGLNLRDYQLQAIRAAESAIAQGAQTALLAMATGTGKTRTVLDMMYRFLKSGRFRRILFLVDRNALGIQALDVFKDVQLEELLPLDKIYNIKDLSEQFIDKETRVHVATVQGMARRILYSQDNAPLPAVTDYDLIIVDEAHRGYILDREMSDDEALYRDQRDYQSTYREVIDYFKAVKIGLTATPALQTTQIFGLPVFHYGYREAVIDGYLVDHDAPHQLTTSLSTAGIHYKQGEQITTYDPQTGVVSNSELLEDELDFDVSQFNRSVVNENFNRAVLEEIAQYIDPEDATSGKTLIYAVNDQHADMIVRILKEIYARELMDTDAIMKITGSIGDRNAIDQAIRRFKNEVFPSIAVTVDLLTTGIDVPEISRLVFLRCVKSRILYEQMLGRATRLCPSIDKTHFEIYDAVGLYKTLEPVSTMKPVAVNPSATFPQLLDGLAIMEEPVQILNQVNQIIAKLQRRKRSMTDEILQHFTDMAGDSPDDFMERLQDMRPREAKTLLLSKTALFELIQNEGYRGGRGIVIDNKPDGITGHTRGDGKGNLPPQDYLQAFATFVQNNRNEVAALNIICTRPADLTREALKSLRLALGREGFTVRQLNSALNSMSNTAITADIISFIRRYAINAELLGHEERIERAVARLKAAHDFSSAEEKWIDRMASYLLNESVLSVASFDSHPAFRGKGGFVALNRLFRNNLESIVAELNIYLYDDGGLAA